MNLYIIGNGFDLYHGFKTSFKDFKEFMSFKHSNVIERWEEILDEKNEWKGLDDDWANLEDSFCHINFELLHELCDCYIVDYFAEEWRDSYHYDYTYELDQYLSLAHYSNSYLREWLKKTCLRSKRSLSLDKDAMYLTFNYTNTLEKIYGICENSVCHIHGNFNSNEPLILGHNNSDFFTEFKELAKYDDDPRIEEGKDISNVSLLNSYKNSELCIESNIKFFKSLENVEKIYIIGHSSSAITKVDKRYYLEIYNRVKNKKIEINVIYYEPNEIEQYKCILNELGFYNISFHDYSFMEI